MNKKKIAILILAVVIVSAGIYGTTMFLQKPDEKAETGPTVQTYQLKRESIMQTLSTSGTVQSSNTMSISSKLSGEIIDTYYEIGSAVISGDTLLTIDVFDINLSIAEKESAISSLNKQIRLLNTEKNLTQLATLDNAKLAYDNALSTYNQNLDLFNSGAISKSDLDQSVLTKDREFNNYNNAKTNYNSYDYKEEISILSENLRIEELRLDELKNNLTNHNITSPITADVTDILVSPGDQISQGTLLYVLEDLDELEIWADISEYEINDIDLGQNVMITTLSDEEKIYNGVVTKIYPTGDISGSDVTIKILIDVSDEDRKLKPNFSVNLEIITKSKTDAFMVPYDALTKTPKGYFVNFGLENVKPIPVETGIESDMMIEIISDQLEDGMDISIVSDLKIMTKENLNRLPGGILPGTKMPSGTGAGRKNN